MLDLTEAFKKLSFNEMRKRWDEYKQLSTPHKYAMQTYVVIAALLVGTLTVVLATRLH